MVRTADDLKAALREQLESLRISGAAYDEGTISEAKRLAGTVYVIVHDGTGRTVSVLTQLGARERMRFLCSAPPVNEHDLLPQMNLVMTVVGPETRYLPLLDRGPPFPPRWQSFTDWWNEPVLRDQSGVTLTRKGLVLILRNQEGGAHFDEELRNQAYIAISRPDFGWKWITSQGERPINPGAHFATMRQIAWEIERSIEATAIL